jgi:hypothetical protein
VLVPVDAAALLECDTAAGVGVVASRGVRYEPLPDEVLSLSVDREPERGIPPALLAEATVLLLLADPDVAGAAAAGARRSLLVTISSKKSSTLCGSSLSPATAAVVLDFALLLAFLLDPDAEPAPADGGGVP